MKFRLQCSGCGATFFAPDRKARYCPKCVKKRAAKTGAVETKREDARPSAKNFGARPERAANKEPKPKKEPVNRTPKITELTPELREQVGQIYQEQFAGSEAPLDQIVSQISDKTWVARKAVRSVINKILHPDVPITPELKERIAEMYKGYVERSERPARGRRRSIADATGVPLGQVMKIVFDWSLSQYNQSPTPELSRQQRFEAEKIYWDEMDKQRHRYDELSERIAERLGFSNAYQIRRLLDMLHDDRNRHDKIADPPPEAEQQIIEAYKQYLAASQPPEKGLHSTIANQIGGVSARQVHKVLQRYRYQRRDEYPLK
ncbi:MAG: hypothetical protein AB7U82_08805 [Blastocatellales bacterium]